MGSHWTMTEWTQNGGPASPGFDVSGSAMDTAALSTLDAGSWVDFNGTAPQAARFFYDHPTFGSTTLGGSASLYLTFGGGNSTWYMNMNGTGTDGTVSLTMDGTINPLNGFLNFAGWVNGNALNGTIFNESFNQGNIQNHNFSGQIVGPSGAAANPSGAFLRDTFALQVNGNTVTLRAVAASDVGPPIIPQ